MRCKDKKLKNQTMYEPHLQYGYILKDIVEYIGVHYSTVKRVIKKLRGKRRSNIARHDPNLIQIETFFTNSQVHKK